MWPSHGSHVMLPWPIWKYLWKSAPSENLISHSNWCCSQVFLTTIFPMYYWWNTVCWGGGGRKQREYHRKQHFMIFVQAVCLQLYAQDQFSHCRCGGFPMAVLYYVLYYLKYTSQWVLYYASLVTKSAGWKSSGTVQYGGYVPLWCWAAMYSSRWHNSVIDFSHMTSQGP